MVQELCKKHNIRYDSMTFPVALKECLLKMNELARDIVTPHEICGGGDSNDDGKLRV